MKRFLTAVLLGAAVFCTPLLAVDDLGIFELDGDAEDTAVTGDDWDTLYGGGGAQTTFSGIIEDFSSPDTIFTGGGSKVPEDFPNYKWKGSPPPPDKTNITNAYAANYIVSGEQVVMFGADLFADNGDAELAFWLLQDDVGLNPDGTFFGNHVEGDLYVASKFSNGGRVAEIAVYAWWPDCDKDDRTPDVALSCAADNIIILQPLEASTCDGSGGRACAITNLIDADSPWPYTPKSGTDMVFPPTTFFEGGINVFSFFGANLCFSSYMVATGASTSFTSTAKDFALGGFDVCSVAASKVCTNDDLTDDTPLNITYDVRGCYYNDGSGSLYLSDFQNNIGGMGNYVPADLTWYETPAGFDAANDCSSATSLADATANGTLVADPSTYALDAGEALVFYFSEASAINAPTDTVTVTAVGLGGALVDPATATDTCPARTFNASLNANKQCEVGVEDMGSMLAVRVNVDGQVCNDGEVDLTLTSLTDAVADGSVTLNPDATTIPAGQCISYTGFYYPQSIPSGDACPFMDQVTVVVTTPVNTAGADCVGDPGGPQTCTVTSNSATCELRVTNGDDDCATGLPKPDVN
jgi:hypothetical protein